MRVALRFVPILALAAWLAASAAGPVKLDGMAASDFDKLPPGAMLDVGGRVLTKAQLLSEIQTKGHLSKATGPKVDLGAAQAKLAADEKALKDTASSKVRAAWETVAPNENLPPLKSEPRIASVEPQPLTCWGYMTIRGTGFGAEAGQVHLLGPFPGGHLSLAVCSAAGGAWGIVECPWRSGVVSTVAAQWVDFSTGKTGLEPVITGIGDGTLQIVVITKKGERSAPFPVAFRARRVLKRLGPPDVQVVRSNPAEGGCVSGAPGATVSCPEGLDRMYHWHVGADRISAKVRNGWTFDSRSSVEIVPATNTGSTIQPFGFEIPLLTIGPDRTTAEVVCTYVSYAEGQWCSVDLLVIGPEDVPSR